MTVYALRNKNLRVLIVTCAPDITDTFLPALDTEIEYFVATSKDFTDALGVEAGFDYVVAMFDPIVSESVTEMRFVASAVASVGVRLCTVAACNPDWIDGLMDECGSIRHFWSFPSADNIRNLRFCFHPYNTIGCRIKVGGFSENIQADRVSLQLITLPENFGANQMF